MPGYPRRIEDTITLVGGAGSLPFVCSGIVDTIWTEPLDPDGAATYSMDMSCSDDGSGRHTQDPLAGAHLEVVGRGVLGNNAINISGCSAAGARVKIVVYMFDTALNPAGTSI